MVLYFRVEQAQALQPLVTAQIQRLGARSLAVFGGPKITVLVVRVEQWGHRVTEPILTLAEMRGRGWRGGQRSGPFSFQGSRVPEWAGGQLARGGDSDRHRQQPHRELLQHPKLPPQITECTQLLELRSVAETCVHTVFRAVFRLMLVLRCSVRA